MKSFLRVGWAVLRAALWRSTPAEYAVPVGTVLLCAVVAAGSDAAYQYLTVDGPARFSIYGVNSIIAEIAVCTAVAMLFISRARTTVLARLFLLDALVKWLSTAAVYVSFKFHGPMPGPSTGFDITILAYFLLVTWWVGAVVAVLRGAGVARYESPSIRGIGLALALSLAMGALPAFPTFSGSDFDLSSYNVWEWGYAKFFKQPPTDNERSVDATAVELSQPYLLEAEIKKLLPERKGTMDIYAIGMAGWSTQDVFIKELNGGLAALNKSLGIDRGTIRLINHRDSVDTSPVANGANFAAAVHAVAGVMNKDEDVLMVFITSHGGPTGVGLYFPGAVSLVLGPQHLASVLDREGIRNRIVIVSACYSGVFAKALASENSIVLTAADENSTSFGCSNEREWTYFGDAFFNQSLTEGVSLEKAFENAKLKVSEWEARDEVPPSSPQGHFGAAISAKLAARVKSDKNARASADEH
jgi:hypothetical protein